MPNRAQIGIIGFGYIGSAVYKHIADHPELGLDVAFVHDLDASRLTDVPPELRLEDLSHAGQVHADLIVELAHPSVSREHGVALLGLTDYMPLSLTALADVTLEKKLIGVAQKQGTSLYIPHGTAIGLEALEEGRDMWEEVTFTMKKPASSVDHSAFPEIVQSQDNGETILYDGPTRGICPLFPRNVNSHAAVALAGIGFDRTRSVFIADPELIRSSITLEAKGDGVEIVLQRWSPMTGVSSAVVLNSIRSSISKVKGVGSNLQIC
tara:strand:- start:1840 stop:2637 length:798 start_codon:yes stop_codon:yes gene_type:complete